MKPDPNKSYVRDALREASREDVAYWAKAAISKAAERFATRSVGNPDLMALVADIEELRKTCAMVQVQLVTKARQ